MHIELEAKFLDINHDQLRAKLTELGAALVYPERQMRRKNFDYPDKRLEKIGGWVRVRDEGDKITLAYKQLNDRTLNGTQEVSVVVDSFNEAVLLLQSIGLAQTSYQETKRELWKLGNVEVTLDTWPWVPPFVELEGGDEASLKITSEQLGLNWLEALHGSVEIVYQKYFNVTEQEVDSWPEIIFGEVPEWLKEKKK